MRILFLSWGVLPQKTGGLEKATYYYLKYLDQFDHTLYLIIPNLTEDVKKFWQNKLKNSKIIGLNIDINKITSYSNIFTVIKQTKSIFSRIKTIIDYKKAVFEYRDKLLKLLENLDLDFDVIYSYDWLTIPAALEIKNKYKKPLVWHVHQTAYDRVGGNEEYLKYLINHDFGIELEACKYADKIICVSNRVKDILIRHYNCNPEKIEVVYNAPDDNFEIKKKNWYKIKQKYKIVLYLGRMTMHKGPDWLLRAAKRVLEFRKDVLFIFAGYGEMLEQLIKMSAEMGIGRNVIFTGWVDDELAEFLYDIADVFVLSSVSEPFGLTPFEALQRENAIIITKQSGVSEILKDAAIVDFWDTYKMADYILAFLEYPKLREFEIMNCLKNMKDLSWHNSSKKVEEILRKAIS
ncbi:MAG: glycosyltransferase family 4 protein [Nanopusillaceae archaeon]